MFLVLLALADLPNCNNFCLYWFIKEKSALKGSVFWNSNSSKAALSWDPPATFLRSFILASNKEWYCFVSIKGDY